MHKYIRSILGNPSQQGKKTQSILCYILQKKDLHHQENLALWKLKMEDLLVHKEQLITIDPGTHPTGTPSTSTQATGKQPTSTPPTGMSKEDWEKLDRRARSTIRLCLPDSVLLNVSGESTTMEIWDKLGNLYQSKSLVNKMFL
jgi:hypothetical protein